MNKEELERRKADTKAYARAEVAKREVMQFRIDADTIEALYKAAEQHGKPVGTMVREWVLEKLSQELGEPFPRSQSSAIEGLMHRMEAMEAVVKRLDKGRGKQSKRA